MAAEHRATGEIVIAGSRLATTRDRDRMRKRPYTYAFRCGRLPDDRKALANLVANVSFFNARDYFGFPLGSAAGEHARAPRRA